MARGFQSLADWQRDNRRDQQSVGHFERSCEGKQRFFSRRDAEDAFYRTPTLDRRADIYSCAYCGSWHWGHQPRPYVAVALPPMPIPVTVHDVWRRPWWLRVLEWILR